MISYLLRIFVFFIILLLPFSNVSAEGYVQLVGIPGLPANKTMTTGEYVNALYILAIGIGAILAVLRIIFAGAKYMFTDIVPAKGDAKKEIKNVILGLLIMLSAVLILKTINPNLQDLNALGKIEPSRTTLLDIDVPKNICSSAPESKECCILKGGKFSLTLDGPDCDVGSIVPISDSGHEDINRVNCITAGLVWDDFEKVCREKGDETRDFPRTLEDEGLDPSNPADIPFIRLLCAEWGTGWQYSEELNKCKKDGGISTGY